jgi:hypothetical protein
MWGYAAAPRPPPPHGRNMMITKRRYVETSHAITRVDLVTQGVLAACNFFFSFLLLGRLVAALRIACATAVIMAEVTALANNTITNTDAFDMAGSNRWTTWRMIRFQNGSSLSPHAPPSSTMTGTNSVSIADWEKVQQIPKILPQADAEYKKQDNAAADQN